MNRDKHLFQFSGALISAAAHKESQYHADRVVWWTRELAAAEEQAKTAGTHLSESVYTGGRSLQLRVDEDINARLKQCSDKIAEHVKAADEFQIHGACYGTQANRTFELHPDDVLYFRLAGGPRSE